MPTNVLGLSAFYHDSAACLIQDGKIIAAASEERFTRKKHDPSFPKNAISFCLKEGGIHLKDLTHVGFYEKPWIKFERILDTSLSTFPKSFSSFLKVMPVWLKEKLWIPQLIQKELEFRGPLYFIEHHRSHAASSFFASPFKEAALLTIDGVGEWSTATYGHAQDNQIELFKEIRFPHSLGLLYSAFTYYLGFKVNSAEYKVMGLAPYGVPRYVDLIFKELVNIQENGSLFLNMRYFAYPYGSRMINQKFCNLFGREARSPETKLEQFHKDIAASIQKVTEEIVLKMARTVFQETKSKNLCLAGGVALNCVANGRVLREGPFEHIYIQPAAGDAGGAFGIASFIAHSILKNPKQEAWPHAYWGPGYIASEIQTLLDQKGVKYHFLERTELLKRVAQLIHEQQVIGWFQGRMEFGPRALGNRSILADARNPKNKDIVNLKIKFRESFRPFAPTILEDKVSEYFELNRSSPYMLLVAHVKENKCTIPAVTHVDGSARIQTVSRKQNELFYDLISEFYQLTGCPVIINTSFNVRGEPIVCTPEDAFRCFMRTHMDILVLGPFLLDKREMKIVANDRDWQKEFELD